MDQINPISIDTRSIDGSLPPYSPARSVDQFVKDYGKEKNGESTTRLVRSFTDYSATGSETFTPIATTPRAWAPSSWKRHEWHSNRSVLSIKKQSIALLALLSFCIAPFFVVGVLLRRESVFFYEAFSTKVQGCGDKMIFGEAVNATVEGAAALFVLDRTYGRLSFSQAKVIDAAWDLVMGRGVQFCAWVLSYIVFSDAILRLIERHPAPFRTFMRLAIEGASLNTAWALLVELCRTRSKRTWCLFFYMLLSTAHVLSIPPFLSAMAGYDSRTVAFVSVGQNDIMPARDLRLGNVVSRFPGLSLEKPTCEADDSLADWNQRKIDLQNSCDCKSPDGSILTPKEWRWSRGEYGYWDCKFNYNGQIQVVDVQGKPQLCNQTYPITINGISNSVHNISWGPGFCLGKQGYEFNQIYKSTRCIPDTQDPTYVWGFSTMIAALFVIMQFIWGLSMYALWQDAQFNSRLVQSGFRLTELRAAFALTEAAHKETGLKAPSLIQSNPRELKKELYGGRGRKSADVALEVLWDDRLEVRRRRGIVEERMSL